MPTRTAAIAAVRPAVKSSATDSCTRKRLAAVQASPPLRILAAIAPAIATSRSASSRTRNGELPPSSIDALMTCGAHSSSRRRPTAVEPVNDSLRTRGSREHGLGERRRLVRADHVDDALRHARLLEQPRDRQRRQRRLLRGLEHDRAARGQRRPELARGHRGREVPGRDQQRDPDRRVRDEHPVGSARGDRELAVRAHGLLGEPAQELGGVGGLAARLGERLAHLTHDQVRDLVVARGHQVERAAEDLGALARGAGGPVRGRGRRGVDRGDPVLRPGGLEGLDDGSVRGIEHGELPSLGGDGHGRTVARR